MPELRHRSERLFHLFLLRDLLPHHLHPRPGRLHLIVGAGAVFHHQVKGVTLATGHRTGVVANVAARLTDPARLAAAVTAMSQQTGYPHNTWTTGSLSCGTGGLALTHAALAAGLGDAGQAAEAVRLCQRGAASITVSTPPSLFGGTAGIAAVDTLVTGRTRTSVWSAFESGMRAAMRRATDSGTPRNDADVDLTVGLVGWGAALLTLPPTPIVTAALERVVTALATRVDDPTGRPAFVTPGVTTGSPLADHAPAGMLYCGLAHGIAGPVALLGLALQHGNLGEAVADEARDATRWGARWLVTHALTDQWGVNWPSAVALRSPSDPVPPGVPALFGISRASWCTGAPGIARALWHAGVALDEPEYRDLALAAIRAALRRPAQARRLPSPTLCHGLAGLALIAFCFARDTGLADLWTASLERADDLCRRYEPDSPLGFRDVENTGRTVDNPGLLLGVCGVALTLLAIRSDTVPRWARLLLLR